MAGGRAIKKSEITNFENKCNRVSVILLNWNSYIDTIECVRSLLQIRYVNYDIIIVDNASEDNSLSKIIKYLEDEFSLKFVCTETPPERAIKRIFTPTNQISLSNGVKSLILLENRQNYGFAKGNNIAIQFAKNTINPEYFLLLNTDTLFDEYFLEELVKIAELNDKIGFVGPKIYYDDYNGRKDIINFVGGVLNIWKGKSDHVGIKEVDQGQFEIMKEVDYVEGSCILIKKEIVEKVGLMNPKYFMYWEEADWCYRAIKLGYKCFYAPKSKLWHKIATSSGGDLSLNHVYYMTRNRFLFMKNNGSKKQKLSFLFYMMGFNIWINLALYTKKQNKKALWGYLKGLKDGIRIFIF